MEEKLYRIEGFEKYMLTKSGKVWSKYYNKFLKLWLEKKGYYRVTLYGESIRKEFIHRLIAKTFIKNPENKPCVNHKNGIKTDNRIENLEWCTYSENSNHAYKTGLKNSGEKHYCSKLKNSDVILIRKLRGKLLQREIGSLFNVDKSTIGEIQRREKWKHI